MAVEIKRLELLQDQKLYKELGIIPQWKPDHKVGKNFAMICYHDARDVQNLLDNVCGPENWQDEPRNIDGKLYMGIGINIEGEGWVWKFDMGTKKEAHGTTDQGKIDSIKYKGESSDAFKRAAIKWGIFRYAYSVPEILLPIAPDGKNPMTHTGKILYTPEQRAFYCNGINQGAGTLRRIYSQYKDVIDGAGLRDSLIKIGELLASIKE